jgi:hypothetical protein
MKRAVLVVTGLAAMLALAACTGGQRRPGPPAKVIERVLATAPGAAQPSDIVKTEIAYRQAVDAQAPDEAHRGFAGEGALLHTAQGPIAFASLEPGTRDPALATKWKPRTVVMSCDGALAISNGRFLDERGRVGTYVTTWVRQRDNSYEWTYDVAGLDDPQPPPRPDFADADIVVTAIDSIRGLVATCPRAGQDIPPPPPIAIGEAGNADAQLSRDGTLRWRWEHRADGAKFVSADYWYEGGWDTAFAESLSSTLEPAVQE